MEARACRNCATITVMVDPLLIAEVGATRLEVCVADITTLDVEAIVNAANRRCSAAAASTAPSIAPPDRS